MDTHGYSQIAGIGAYLPQQVIGSDELLTEVCPERFGIPSDYLSRQVGILERRFAPIKMQPSELATLASESALKHSGVTPSEIDLIIFAGITRDYEEPATAHNVQRNLGAGQAVCLDISNACLGFMSGLAAADAFIASGQASTVLVCSGETPSKIVHELLPLLRTTQDKREFESKIGVLTTGDAGAAAVVTPKEPGSRGWSWYSLCSDGRHSKLCYYNKTPQGIEGQMEMTKICALTLRIHVEQFKRTSQMLNWHDREPDLIYCHQVGAIPHRQLLSRVGLPQSRAPITYDYFGNLTSATIPVLMHLNPPKPKDRLLFLCSGSGISVFQGGMTA